MSTAAFTLTSTTSERAIIATMARGENRMVLTIPRDIAEHPDVGQPITALNATLTGNADYLTREAPNLSEQGFNAAAIARVPAIAAQFRLTVEAQRAALTRVTDTLDGLLTPGFPETFPIARRIEARAFARTLEPGALFDLAMSEAAIGAAVVEGGAALSGLPADGFERLRRAVAVEQFAHTIWDSNRVTMRVAPSVSDPIGGAPDMATARTNAAARIEALEAEKALLERVPAVLSNVVLSVALLTGETREATLARLI
jgi:hypothetical protein